MNSISRCAVRISSALLATLAAVAFAAGPARAATAYVFDGKPLPISHVQSYGGKTAIAVNDPGLRDLLRDVGATLTWNPDDRYVLFTTAEPRIISFAVGDTRYDVGPLTAQASFAPFEHGGTVYVPFDELLRALYLAIKPAGGTAVIQPQLAAIDVQAAEGSVRIVGRAGVPLHPRLLRSTGDRVVYAFDGVGTTLERSRAVNAPGIREIDVTQSGGAADPVTQLTLMLTPGATHGAPSSDDGRDFIITLAGSGEAPAAERDAAVAPANAAPPEAQPSPTATAAGAVGVTAVEERSDADAYTVTISVSGDATYDWHRLRAPDNRFWIDINDAQLQMPPRDDPGGPFVAGVRIRQVDASTVRVALSLQGQKTLEVTPTVGGVQIVVHADEAADDMARAGSGGIGAATVAVAAAPPAPIAASPQPGPWKFGPQPAASGAYVPKDPRLIVIDPGHGGSDPGTVHGGQREADLTLDMAKRLRAALVARGWQVIMTRDSDVDVYKPYDTARAELQARDDIANKPGARLLVSIHVNGYVNSGPRGTTTYYSKPEDVPLAKSVQHDLIASLGTADDGIVKSHLYVTLHAAMPAILVETAFLTNPGDFARLTSPAWRQKVAEAIAQGIADYAGAPPPAPSGSDQ